LQKNPKVYTKNPFQKRAFVAGKKQGRQADKAGLLAGWVKK
jgi:hypothetical protein